MLCSLNTVESQYKYYLTLTTGTDGGYYESQFADN